jgi:transposase
LFKERLVPKDDVVIDWLRRLPGPVATAYEAGPTGFGLSRAINGAGIRCVVAAPSKLNRPSGERVKTDARDALLLAKLLRNDDLTPVRVPSVTQEAARDLVRAREDVRGDLMRARHRVTKLQLRQGELYCGGAAWTGKHLAWLTGSSSPCPALRPRSTPTSRPSSSRWPAATGSTKRSPRWRPIRSSPM